MKTKYLEQRERHRDAAEQRGREGKRRTKRQRTYRCLAKVAAAERAGPRSRTPADFCLSTCLSSPPAVSVQHPAEGDLQLEPVDGQRWGKKQRDTRQWVKMHRDSEG